MQSNWLGLAGTLGILLLVQPTVHARGDLEILFAYGSEKEEWIKEVTAKFNAAGSKTLGGQRIVVRLLATGSGECMSGVAAGAIKAHVVSPASALFIRLANAEAKAVTGKELVPETENLVLSPVVIAMWKPMAEAMGWGQKPIGWGDILTLARNEQGWASLGMPQWGRFKLGHTHPDYSNSGFIALIAETYAAAAKTAGLAVEDLARPETLAFVRDIEGAIVHYGASTGFFGKRMFANGPDFLSAAVLYENMVIESASSQYKLPFPVVAVYPKEGTFWSDHPAGVVQADWVTAEHREAGRLYLKYLLAKPQQERALAYGFRPGLVEIPLTAPVDAAHGVDPREPKTTLEVPSPAVLKAFKGFWEQTKKRSNVVLVFDTSGSMKEEDRLGNARRGALQMLKVLGDEDYFGLLPFNNQISWAFKSTKLAQDRARAERTLGGLWANGGTALYDAIIAAHQELSTNAIPGKISAIVVLTDGQDTSSRQKLPQLLEQIKFDSERTSVRIFTIAYGKDANRKVLQDISEATKAKSYGGTTGNIETVFRDISTFF